MQDKREELQSLNSQFYRYIRQINQYYLIFNSVLVDPLLDRVPRDTTGKVTRHSQTKEYLQVRLLSMQVVTISKHKGSTSRRRKNTWGLPRLKKEVQFKCTTYSTISLLTFTYTEHCPITYLERNVIMLITGIYKVYHIPTLRAILRRIDEWNVPTQVAYGNIIRPQAIPYKRC